MAQRHSVYIFERLGHLPEKHRWLLPDDGVNSPRSPGFCLSRLQRRDSTYFTSMWEVSPFGLWIWYYLIWFLSLSEVPETRFPCRIVPSQCRDVRWNWYVNKDTWDCKQASANLSNLSHMEVVSGNVERTDCSVPLNVTEHLLRRYSVQWSELCFCKGLPSTAINRIFYGHIFSYQLCIAS